MRVTSAAAVLALCGAACQYNPAPQGWLPTPVETPQWAYGGWIEIELRPASPNSAQGVWTGELLAVSGDSVWVLTAQGARGVAVEDVATATLIGWDPELHTLIVWTAVGTVATISNGLFLIFSAPAWVIAGTLASAAQSRRPVLSTETTSWPSLRVYARFPQGLPPGLDLTTLALPR